MRQRRFLWAAWCGVCAGCAQGGCRSPLVFGNGVLGIGCYEHRESHVSPDSHVVVVDGIGIAFIHDRLILGFANIEALLSASPENNLTVHFDRAEVHLGAAANREAARMAREARTISTSN